MNFITALLTLFRMEGGRQKDPPYQCFPCNFYKRRNYARKRSDFLAFVPSPSPKLSNLNQNSSSKKASFVVKTLSNWGSDNLSHRSARVTKLWSHDHVYKTIWIAGDVTVRNYNVISFILKYRCFKKTWGSLFCWHHRNYNHFH